MKIRRANNKSTTALVNTQYVEIGQKADISFILDLVIVSH